MKHPGLYPIALCLIFLSGTVCLPFSAQAMIQPLPVADTIEVYLFESLCAGQSIAGQQPEQDTILQLFCSGNSIHPDTLKTIEVDVLPLPDVQILGDTVLCQGEQSSLEAVGFFASYLWSTGETSPGILVEMPGQYSLNVTSSNGCLGQQSILVSSSLPSLNVEAGQPSCPDIQDGAIFINQFSGGIAPFEVSVNGGAFSTDTAFTNLAPGTYQLLWVDAAGCSDSLTTVLEEPSAFSLDIGPDVTLFPGDSLNMSPMLTGTATSWLWTPGHLFDCDTCATPSLLRPETATITLQAENASGCIATDSRELLYRDEFQLFVPNVFAPHNGNSNTTLRVFPGPGNWQLITFEVYNRWGGPLFQSTGPIQYPGFLEWDGRAKGELAAPGVYLWVAELALNNGQKQIRRGSITIIR